MIPSSPAAPTATPIGTPRRNVWLRCLPPACVGLLLWSASCTQPAAPEANAPAHPLEPEILAFVENYFEVWSAGDMEGYRNLFDTEAVIQFIAPGHDVKTMARDPFIETQVQAHRNAATPMREYPLSSEFLVSRNDRVAQASVRWELAKDSGRVRGWNHFTIIRGPDGWRILHLVYYAE